MNPLERQAKLVRQLTAVRAEIREAEILLLCTTLSHDIRRQMATALELRQSAHERIEKMLGRKR